MFTLEKLAAWSRRALRHLPGVIVLGVLIAAFVLGPRLKWNPMNLPSLFGGAAPAVQPARDEVAAVVGSDGVITLADSIVRKVGLKTARASTAPVRETVTANGEIQYDPTRVAQLSSRVGGTVGRVLKQVGDPVRRGDVLALVDSLEVGKAKTDLLTALVQFRLKTKNLESIRDAKSAIPELTRREAEAAVSEAQIRLIAAREALGNLGLPVNDASFKDLPEDRLADRLRYHGLPADLVRALEQEKASANLIPLVAPFDGIVIGRDVVGGEVVSSARPQFVVADVRRVWVLLEVRPEDAARVAVGQPATFRPDGHPSQLSSGHVSWISTESDARTRTLQTRVVADNPDGHLHANNFGLGRITIRQKDAAVVVPQESLQRDGERTLVWVRTAREGGCQLFEPREVTVGIRGDDSVEITRGVRPGEEVVTGGSYLLKAELVRRRQSAGS